MRLFDDLLLRIKREVGGMLKTNTKMGCRCGARLRAKSGGGQSLTHTRWRRGRGYLRRGSS
jgi:hypothetical protein